MYRPTEGRRPILFHLRHLFLGLALLLLGLAAQARPLSLVLFPGDPATLTAVNAVQQLQREPALQQVRFHMVQSGFLPEDYDALIAEHTRLIETVIAGDADNAEKLARSHNDAEVKLLAKRLREGDGAAPAAPPKRIRARA